MVILFLSFKRITTTPNELIDSQHYKRLRGKILIAFHSASHFTLTTTQLNSPFLKTFNYSKTIQRLLLPFRDLHWFHLNVMKTNATFWSEVHLKPMTNLEFSEWAPSRCKTCPFSHNVEKMSGPKRSIKIRSLYMHLRQCHLLHNLHLLQKVIHWWNRKTIRWPIPRTPPRRWKKWQGRIQTIH